MKTLNKVLILTLLFTAIYSKTFAKITTDTTTGPELRIELVSDMASCIGTFAEVKIIYKNLPTAEPKFKVFSHSTDPRSADQELNLVYVENKFYFDNSYTAGRSIFVLETTTGLKSAILGPFKNDSYEVNPQKNLAISQKPEPIFLENVKNKLQINNFKNEPIFWFRNNDLLDNGKNYQTLPISQAGTYSYYSIYTGDCYFKDYNENSNFADVYKIEDITATINRSRSCDKQVRIDLEFKGAFYRNLENKLNITWKLNGNEVAKNKNFFYLATELGNYSATISYGNKSISTNTFIVDKSSFFKSRLASALGGGTLDYCGYMGALNMGYFGFYSPGFGGTLTQKDSVNIRWIVDDVVQDKKTAIFQLPKNKESFYFSLNYKEGLCDYYSEKKKAYSYNPTISLKKTIVEECIGKEIDLSCNLISNVYGITEKGIYTWYKDGKLFSEAKFGVGGKSESPNLKTTESGKYVLQQRISNTDCVVHSDTIRVSFKNEVLLNARPVFDNRYITKIVYDFCTPASAEVPIVLNSPAKIEWYRDGHLLPDSTYHSSNLKQRGGFFNLASNKISMQTPGNYYAKIYPQDAAGCVILSDTVNYQKKNILPLIINTIPCLNYKFIYIDERHISHESLYQNQYEWTKNGEVIPEVNSYYNQVEESAVYKLKSKDSTSCNIESKPIEIFISKPNPALTLANDTTICQGANLKLDLIDNKQQKIVEWYKDKQVYGKLSGTLNITEPGNYYNLYTNECNYYYSNAVNIGQTPLPTAKLTASNKELQYGQATDLNFELSSIPPWQIRLNTGEEFKIDKSPYLLSVRPITDTKISIASVKNICGFGSTAGEVNIKILILADEADKKTETLISVYPIPVIDNADVEITSGNAKSAQISLLNSLGVPIKFYTAYFYQKKLKQSIPVQSLSSGLYILKINIEGKVYSRKLIKE